MNKSIEFNSKYINFKEEILSIIKNFSTSNGQTIKDHRNNIKKFSLEQIQINVKSFGVPNFFNSIVYAFFRLSKANRSYNYAMKLLNLGINTPAPICYHEVKKNGLLTSSFYVSEQLDFDFAISEVINNVNYPWFSF